MSIYKGQYICEGRGRGWTESWFWEGSQGTLDTQGAAFETTFETRRLLLGKEYGMKGIRVSEELNDAGQPVIGDSWLQRREAVGYTQQPGWEEDLALVVKCQNAQRSKRRMMYMRGLWDEIEHNGGVYFKAYKDWDTALGNWLTKLKVLTPGWITRTPSAKIGIATAVMGDDNLVTITLNANLFVAGVNGFDRTQLSINTAGVDSVLAGLHVVQPTSTTQAIIIKPLAIFPTNTTGWRANTFEYDFQPAFFIEPSHITRRPPGAPLLEPLGRSRAKARG